MLIGHYIQKIGAKGRIALPGKFKKELGKNIILSRWYEKSLAIFSLAEWEKVVEQATGGMIITSPARNTERFLLGGAYELVLDDQGRFVVPRPARDYALLSSKNEAVFVGLGKRIEVWNSILWHRREKDIIKHAEELIEQTQKLRKKE